MKLHEFTKWALVEKHIDSRVILDPTLENQKSLLNIVGFFKFCIFTLNDLTTFFNILHHNLGETSWDIKFSHGEEDILFQGIKAYLGHFDVYDVRLAAKTVL